MQAKLIAGTQLLRRGDLKAQFAKQQANTPPLAELDDLVLGTSLFAPPDETEHRLYLFEVQAAANLFSGRAQ